MLPRGVTSSPKEKSDELTKAQVALGASSQKLGAEKLSGARKSGSQRPRTTLCWMVPRKGLHVPMLAMECQPQVNARRESSSGSLSNSSRG
jgi:hypothetical protein